MIVSPAPVPWTSPPPRGVGLRSDILRKCDGAYVALNGTAGNLICTDNTANTFLRQNPSNPGYFTPRGLRFYSTHGGDVNDGIEHAETIKTARGNLCTLIFRFCHIENTRLQSLHRAVGDDSEGYKIDHSSSMVTVGYDGLSGFKYLIEGIPMTLVAGRYHNFVISTDPFRDLMSVGIDGRNAWDIPGTTISGQASYIGGGSSIPLSRQSILGGGGSVSFTNYYSLHGWLHLWCILPGVFFSQVEATALSANPWAVFQPRHPSRGILMSAPAGPARVKSGMMFAA